MKYLVIKQTESGKVVTTTISEEELAGHIRATLAYTTIKILSIVLIP